MFVFYVQLFLYIVKYFTGIKRPNESRISVIEHISSFPRVPCHYRRKNTSKEYLPHDLNLSIMYKLYVEKCKTEGIEPEKPSFYRNIFHTNFNLSFHTLKSELKGIQHSNSEKK